MPKTLNEMNNDLDIVDLSKAKVFSDFEEELEDYSTIETIEEQHEREIDESSEQILKNQKSQSIFVSIFLSLIGKQNGYTSIDNKLQNNTSKVIFMIASLLFLILMFVIIGIFMK